MDVMAKAAQAPRDDTRMHRAPPPAANQTNMRGMVAAKPRRYADGVSDVPSPDDLRAMMARPQTPGLSPTLFGGVGQPGPRPAAPPLSATTIVPGIVVDQSRMPPLSRMDWGLAVHNYPGAAMPPSPAAPALPATRGDASAAVAAALGAAPVGMAGRGLPATVAGPPAPGTPEHALANAPDYTPEGFAHATRGLSINQMQALWPMQHYDPKSQLLNKMLNSVGEERGKSPQEAQDIKTRRNLMARALGMLSPVYKDLDLDEQQETTP